MFSNTLLIVNFPTHLHGQFQHHANLIEFNLISTNASSALSALSTTSHDENDSTIMVHYLDNTLQEMGYLSAELFTSNLHIAFFPALNVELEVILTSSGLHAPISINDAIIHQIQSIKKYTMAALTLTQKRYPNTFYKESGFHHRVIAPKYSQ
jgi:hypothetical protein